MHKVLPLLPMVLAIGIMNGNAKTITYTSDELGEVTAISSNGEYASVYDYENNKAYLWTRATGEFKDISAPLGSEDQPSGKRIRGTWAMGVADDGTVVGCILYADGRQYPSIYKDGEWSQLPLHGAAMNDNTAIAITGDSKVIGGYQFINDPSSNIAGRYYPCRWTLKDDGTYELTSYTDIDLPNHQGFYPTCMTPDGSAIGGMVFAGVSSTIPAIITAEGEFTMFAKVEENSQPWEYKGKYYCGFDEATGKQIWTDDPEDPRIVIFTEVLIDGVKDEASEGKYFNGGFQGADADGNFYGMRTVASNVSDGTGKLTTGATIYNTGSGTWNDRFEYQAFTNGIGKYIFGPQDILIIDGKESSFSSAFGFSYSRSISAMYKLSADGRVIGGNTYEVNPATNEPQFFPFIIELDEPLASGAAVDSAMTDENIGISVADNTILVSGAKSVAVYDINGRFLSSAASTAVQNGLYIVVADGKSSKVLVK